jgi:hypothetical protein
MAGYITIAENVPATLKVGKPIETFDQQRFRVRVPYEVTVDRYLPVNNDDLLIWIDPHTNKPHNLEVVAIIDVGNMGDNFTIHANEWLS